MSKALKMYRDSSLCLRRITVSLEFIGRDLKTDLNFAP